MNDFEVKDVRFSRIDDKIEGICAVCSVSLNDSVVIHGVKVKRHNGKLYAFMPERRVGIDEQVLPVITYIDQDFKTWFEKQVIEAYIDEVYND